MKAEMLTLNESVHLVSSTGYEVRLTEAVVDVHKGNVVSEKPVWVKLTNGVLTANRLEVVDGGELIRFSERRFNDRNSRIRKQHAGESNDDALVLALGHVDRIGGAGIGSGASSARRRGSAGPGCICKSKKSKTRICRSRSSRRRLRCATRAKWRRSPATCRWCRVIRRSNARRSSCSTAPAGTGRRSARFRHHAFAPGAARGAAAAGPGRAAGSQDIRRIEARGSVTVISKDQNASGDLGVYDVKKKTITLLEMSWSARARTSSTAIGSWSIPRPETPTSMVRRQSASGEPARIAFAR